MSSVPVGHQGARVDIVQRPALALNGWFGVIIVAVCAAAIAYLVTNGTGWLWLPILVAALVLSALVVVPPGQTQVV